MLVAAVHKRRLNKISVAAEADIVIVFQVLAYSKPVWLVPSADFSLSRDKISSKKFCFWRDSNLRSLNHLTKLMRTG